MLQISPPASASYPAPSPSPSLTSTPTPHLHPHPLPHPHQHFTQSQSHPNRNPSCDFTHVVPQTIFFDDQMDTWKGHYGYCYPDPQYSFGSFQSRPNCTYQPPEPCPPPYQHSDNNRLCCFTSGAFCARNRGSESQPRTHGSEIRRLPCSPPLAHLWSCSLFLQTHRA